MLGLHFLLNMRNISTWIGFHKYSTRLVLIRESGYFYHFYAACCVGIFRPFHRSSIALVQYFGFCRSMYYRASVLKISKWFIIGYAAYIYNKCLFLCIDAGFNHSRCCIYQIQCALLHDQISILFHSDHYLCTIIEKYYWYVNGQFVCFFAWKCYGITS